MIVGVQVWLLLAGASSAGEGTAQLGTSQAMRASLTEVHVDVLDAAVETFVWSGTSFDASGALVSVGADVFDPSGAFIGRFASGSVIVPPAGNGAYRLEVGDDLAGGACCDPADPSFDLVCCATPDGVVEDLEEWDVTVSGAAAGRGRVWSDEWWFDAGTYSSAGALEGSFYFLVNGGGPSNDGVVELEVDGLAGFLYTVAGNSTGMAGAHGRSVADVGQPFVEEHRIYLLPPEDADFDALVASASNGSVAYEEPACSAVAPGIPGLGASFSLDASVAGTLHLVCDLDGDGIYSYTADADAHRIAPAVVGFNDIDWDGLDNVGNPAPAGTADCALHLTVGELHYPARDVETAYEGLRAWALDAGLQRAGAPTFWNDAAVQAGEDEVMPNGQLSAVESPVGGLFPGVYGDVPVAHAAAAGGNARGWGSFDSTSKGESTYLDTWTFLSVDEISGLVVAVVDASADSDGDGVDDVTETCGLGTDPGDPDSDDDGLLDGEEATLGTDPNASDTDGDSYSDAIETPDPSAPPDTDGDGLIDPLDADDDGDGLDTIAELDEDSDGDGADDRLDDDDDDDSVPTALESGDTDGDTVPDYLDDDDDDDGLPTLDEVGFDHDLDGIDDPLDADDDGDGIDTRDERAGDSDGDGAEDVIDDDDDGDGIPTLVEGIEDGDLDGEPNYLDPDSDADGLSDAVEGVDDPDLDGFGAFEDVDSDGDTMPDAVEGLGDLDGDGTPNRLDGDDDGDTVDTFDELTTWLADGADPLNADDDGDGLPTADEIVASGGVSVSSDAASGDLAPDWLDTDADEDSRLDAEEGLEDFDGDGLADAQDPDDDDDGISTFDEEQVWGSDPENPDDDFDGLVGEGTNDPDGDDAPSFLDEDSDGDTLLDSLEGFDDPDGDGIGAYEDLDSDDDGVSDTEEGGASDHDADLVPDRLDADDDNDGVGTVDEVGDTDGDGILDRFDLDDDGDGLATRDELADGLLHGLDPDGDGRSNWVDTDSDDDGLLDSEEGRDADSDGDGAPDYLDADILGAWYKGGGACSALGAKPAAGWLAGVAALALIRRRRKVAVSLAFMLVGPTAVAGDGPEISTSRGSSGGALILWPRVASDDPALSVVAGRLQARLQASAGRIFSPEQVRVRPEPERACPLSGCRGVSVGVLLAAQGGGCAAVAWVGAPDGGPVTLVPWAGTVQLTRTELGFRESPESAVRVQEFVPCDQLIAALDDTGVEGVIRGLASP